MEHLGTKTLETPRLRLRRFTMDDVQAMYDNWASDDEVTKYLMWPTHTDVNVTERILESWISKYSESEFYQWAIVPKDNANKPVGSISVVSWNDRVEKVTVGYCIGRNWWHRGITSEVLQAVIGYMLNEVGMRRVDAYHDPNNPHSGNVMKKCGMIYEGTLRQSDWNNQGICDANWYAILAKEP